MTRIVSIHTPYSRVIRSENELIDWLTHSSPRNLYYIAGEEFGLLSSGKWDISKFDYYVIQSMDLEHLISPTKNLFSYGPLANDEASTGAKNEGYFDPWGYKRFGRSPARVSLQDIRPRVPDMSFFNHRKPMFVTACDLLLFIFVATIFVFFKKPSDAVAAIFAFIGIREFLNLTLKHLLRRERIRDARKY